MTQQDAYRILEKFANQMEEFFEDAILVVTHKDENGQRSVVSVDFGEDIVKTGMLKWLQDELMSDLVSDKVEDASIFRDMAFHDDDDDDDDGEDWKKKSSKT